MHKAWFFAAAAPLLIAAQCSSSPPDPVSVVPGPTPTPLPTPTATATPIPVTDLVFTRDPNDQGPQSPTSRQQLFFINANGTGLTQQSADGINRFLPHFSPDGRRVLFTKFYRGGYGSADVLTDVVVLDLATNRESRLTNLTNGWQGAWSPDGTRIVFGTNDGQNLYLMNADGSAQRRIGGPSGAADDIRWGDWLWSSDDWIYFVVMQRTNGCEKVRIDRMRSDGTGRVKITDGGPNCAPAGFQDIGDADPGISPDGRWIYSSRGLPRRVPGFPDTIIRHLFRISTDPYTPDKTEEDLGQGVADNCIAGVPKVAPDGVRIALFLFCPNDAAHAGVTLTDSHGSAYAFLTQGFGADWYPVAR